MYTSIVLMYSVDSYYWQTVASDELFFNIMSIVIHNRKIFSFKHDATS